jgi:hypothetical protein
MSTQIAPLNIQPVNSLANINISGPSGPIGSSCTSSTNVTGIWDGQECVYCSTVNIPSGGAAKGTVIMTNTPTAGTQFTCQYNPVFCDSNSSTVNSDGKCVYPVYTLNCPSGGNLVNGVCVYPPSFTLVCPSGTKLVDGTCNYPPSYQVTCPSGSNLVNGSCVYPDNIKLVCPTNSSVVNGLCQYPPPYPINCPSGSKLYNGSCIFPPSTACPIGTKFINTPSGTGVCQSTGPLVRTS